jgi:hypothetical protein
VEVERQSLEKNPCPDLLLYPSVLPDPAVVSLGPAVVSLGPAVVSLGPAVVSLGPAVVSLGPAFVLRDSPVLSVLVSLEFKDGETPLTPLIF